MKRKKVQFPSALTILLIIAALVAVMTYFVPGGKFDTIAYDKENNEFVVVEPGSDKKPACLTKSARQSEYQNSPGKVYQRKYFKADGNTGHLPKGRAEPPGFFCFFEITHTGYDGFD